MKNHRLFWLLAMFLILSPMSLKASMKSGDFNDKTLSPYFLVNSDDPNVDQLPLKSTSAAVSIAGVIADVKVSQVYKNEGKNPLEAVYVFPGSTRAAVYGMTVKIGERTIVAQIRERRKARQEYEQAKQEGRTASLLEQQRPNVFQMNVANILPGDLIEVELRYTELLVPTDGVYEFAYPTVVGPRYSNQPAETALPSEGWIQNPYLHEGQSPTYEFDIKVNLSAGMPIQEVVCNSHKVDASFNGPSLANIELAESENHGGNRDYILKYRLAGTAIESGLLLYKGDVENFFLLMMQPPKRVADQHIPRREYIFIVDVSGSMRGFPLDTSKQLLKNLISQLRPSDKFNVLLFAGGSTVMSQRSLPATLENINQAFSVIDQQQGGGGTELLPALKRVLALPQDEGISRTIIIATDGYVSVEKEAFDLIRNHLRDSNVFAFGIGSSVNRHLIEGLARAGMGEPFVVTGPDVASTKAEEFRQYVRSPLLTHINIDYGTFEVYDVEPPTIPDVLAEQPVIAFGKWRGAPQGNIKLKGVTADGPYTTSYDVTRSQPADANTALRYLWARHRVAVLGDYNRLEPDDKRTIEITNLGLTYNLLTDYTSFIAVDTQVRRTDGKVTTVRQVLPLPEGVSDLAVGAERRMSQVKMLRPSPLVNAKMSEQLAGAPVSDAAVVRGSDPLIAAHYVANQREKFSTEEAYLDACITEAQKYSTQAKSSNELLNKMIKETQVSIGELKNEIKSDDSRKQSAKTQVDSLKAKKRKIDDMIEDFEKEIKAQERAIKMASEKSGKLAELKKQVTVLREELLKIKQRSEILADLIDEIDQLTA